MSSCSMSHVHSRINTNADDVSRQAQEAIERQKLTPVSEEQAVAFNADPASYWDQLYAKVCRILSLKYALTVFSGHRYNVPGQELAYERLSRGKDTATDSLLS